MALSQFVSPFTKARAVPDSPHLPTNIPLALKRNEDVVRWLDLLHVFDRVDELLIIGDGCPNFARALQRVSTEMGADALPALRKLTLSPFTSESEEAITSFIDARNLAGHPAIKLNEPAVSSPD
ncbi:hypothetical protein EDB83DRAFT_2309877 [Lactarius deliciosus]|nr:hypothetical protein EDB83DRAFT_2309877 [Lactarius deliciosus]